MARLTIEDQWWTDPRREKLAGLVGGFLMADAVAIRLWRAAQEFWGSGKQPMPLEVFETFEHYPSIVQAKLATIENDGVYVRGTRDYHTWLAEKRSSAAAGGKKSAQRPRDAKGRLKKISKLDPSTDQAEAKMVQPSGSGSSSDSGSKKIPKTSSSGESLPAIAKGKNSVALWMEAYHRRYGCRYPALGKDTGTLVGLEKTYTGPQLEILFACYLAIKEPLYESQKHPLSLFFRDLPKISVAAQTGVDPSKPEKFDPSNLKD